MPDQQQVWHALGFGPQFDLERFACLLRECEVDVIPVSDRKETARVGINVDNVAPG